METNVRKHKRQLKNGSTTVRKHTRSIANPNYNPKPREVLKPNRRNITNFERSAIEDPGVMKELGEISERIQDVENWLIKEAYEPDLQEEFLYENSEEYGDYLLDLYHKEQREKDPNYDGTNVRMQDVENWLIEEKYEPDLKEEFLEGNDFGPDYYEFVKKKYLASKKEKEELEMMRLDEEEDRKFMDALKQPEKWSSKLEYVEALADYDEDEAEEYYKKHKKKIEEDKERRAEEDYDKAIDEFEAGLAQTERDRDEAYEETGRASI